MFLATIADRRTAASWGGEKKVQKTHPESAFGWVLIGWVLGRSLGLQSFGPRDRFLFRALCGGCAISGLCSKPRRSQFF